MPLPPAPSKSLSAAAHALLTAARSKSKSKPSYIGTRLCTPQGVRYIYVARNPMTPDPIVDTHCGPPLRKPPDTLGQNDRDFFQIPSNPFKPIRSGNMDYPCPGSFDMWQSRHLQRKFQKFPKQCLHLWVLTSLVPQTVLAHRLPDNDCMANVYLFILIGVALVSYIFPAQVHYICPKTHQYAIYKAHAWHCYRAYQAAGSFDSQFPDTT